MTVLRRMKSIRSFQRLIELTVLLKIQLTFRLNVYNGVKILNALELGHYNMSKSLSLNSAYIVSDRK